MIHKMIKMELITAKLQNLSFIYKTLFKKFLNKFILIFNNIMHYTNLINSCPLLEVNDLP